MSLSDLCCFEIVCWHFTVSKMGVATFMLRPMQPDMGMLIEYIL